MHSFSTINTDFFYCNLLFTFLLESNERPASLKKLPNDALHLFTERTNTMAYCDIPKSASSTFRHTFCMSQKGCRRLFIQNNLTRFTNTEELSQVNKLNIVKFMFVRHPFERLVSAYNSKLERPKTRKASKNERKILIMQIRKYQEKNMNMSSNDPCLATSSSQFPFSCFVDYVLEEAKNTYWWPYTELCRVCHVQYDLIGHVEDFHDDFQILQEKFSANKVLMEISKQKKNVIVKTNVKKIRKTHILNIFIN